MQRLFSARFAVIEVFAVVVGALEVSVYSALGLLLLRFPGCLWCCGSQRLFSVYSGHCLLLLRFFKLLLLLLLLFLWKSAYIQFAVIGVFDFVVGVMEVSVYSALVLLLLFF